MSPAIGIDLGTTYSCVGHFKNNRVNIIENDHGNRTTPSFVAFTETETLVGDAAQQQSAMNPKNTIYDAKRLIGRKFSDPEVQADLKHYTFQVSGKNDEPVIKVEKKGQIVEYTPEKISSLVLGKMKQTAEQSLGVKVQDAVVTVPAYFNNKQRELTQKAGTLAGLNVLEILNEPTAAALAYAADLSPNKKNVLIFDLGGGTFDVSLVQHENSNVKVLATAGDVHLGGEDFDSKLVTYFADFFKKSYGGSILGDYRAMRRLRAGCERTKRKLSFSEKVSIEIDYLHGGNDLYTSITREKFENLCSPLFKSTLEHVQQVLTDTNLTKDQVDEVVLVGGSTRIPKVRQLLQDFFNGKTLNCSVNVDEAVAYGAAVRAASLTNDLSDVIQKLKLQDVCTISLSTNVLGDLASTIIPRNTPIPVTMSRWYITPTNFQTGANVCICEGERPLFNLNRELGSFRLDGFPPLPAGEVIYSICLNLDASGILKVTATYKSNAKVTASTVIKNVNQSTSNGGADRIFLKDAREFKEQDAKEVKRMKAYANLYTLVQSIKQTLDKYPYYPLFFGISRETNDANVWLTQNRSTASFESFVSKYQQLERSSELTLKGYWSPKDAGYRYSFN